MVGTLPPPSLCSFSTERRRSVDVKATRELRISATKLDQRGWMSENSPSLQPREKCFLLTSPFIEPGPRLTPDGERKPAPIRLSELKKLPKRKRPWILVETEG